jgi:hypothetical protein
MGEQRAVRFNIQADVVRLGIDDNPQVPNIGFVCTVSVQIILNMFMMPPFAISSANLTVSLR